MARRSLCSPLLVSGGQDGAPPLPACPEEELLLILLPHTFLQARASSDLSRVLPKNRAAPPVEIQQLMLVVYLFVYFKQNSMENCGSQKSSHGQMAPGPGHLGSGKDCCTLTESMIGMSDSELILALDQGAKELNCCLLVVLEQIPSPGPLSICHMRRMIPISPHRPYGTNLI